MAVAEAHSPTTSSAAARRLQIRNPEPEVLNRLPSVAVGAVGAEGFEADEGRPAGGGFGAVTRATGQALVRPGEREPRPLVVEGGDGEGLRVVAGRAVGDAVRAVELAAVRVVPGVAGRAVGVEPGEGVDGPAVLG